MNRTTIGWTAFIGCLGMMLTLTAGDVGQLKNWSDALYPAFVAGVFAHLGSVIGAFLAGKIMPSQGDRRTNAC